ncbi:translocon-associated protein subunit beta [Strigomonas culicis]|uniref:Translocon-associated protein subunit beta n=1 Tax=Strigomonas culicis TaxID=28005 RepID=S9UAS8_9TRYP|nr:translocon-associated protein subunit beta [Strigomonas culicis]EPY32114.1 translocon-associated protein subunit beta [Strigomonas culicis]|eukprot:EPY27902.1 translocon-associated protein subunit beta [Strigomonas culicis]
MFRKLLLSVVLLALVATFACAQVESTDPLLLVSKRTSSDDIVLGAEVEVVVEVRNLGQSPAFDVVLEELLVDGTEKKEEAEMLAPSAAIELRYTVVPTTLGRYKVGVAHVTYNVEQGNAATQRRAVSNVIHEEKAFYRGEAADDMSVRGVVSVLTEEEYGHVHASYVKETIAYVFLGVTPAFFPYVLYSMKRTQVGQLLRQSKRK